MQTRMTAVVVMVAASLTLACETKTPYTPEEASAFAEGWAPTLEIALLERTEGASVTRELTAVIDAAAAKSEANTQRKEPPYDVFVKEVYAAREYKPAIVLQGKLTPAGEAIWTEVQHVTDHALDPEPYRLADISKAIDALKASSGEHSSADLAATDADKKWVADWLAAQDKKDFDIAAEGAHEAATDALIASGAAARLDPAMKAHEAFGAALAKDSAQLEWMLAHGWTKFSRDVGNRHVRDQFIHKRHDDFYNDPEIRRQNERPPEARGAYTAGVIWRHASQVAKSMRNETAILHRRIRESLANVLTAEKPAEVARAVWPAHPQYAKLLPEYKRYRAIVDAGGWEDVPEKKRLKVGARDSVVKALKKRLQVEGYYPAGDLDTKYDNGLKEAIISYQRTHQMEVTGEPHRTFWRSINVPAKRRLAQIELNIQRWRFTNTAHDVEEAYVYVNIPDFTAELWDKQKREMRFEIVVGNNDLVEDAETGEKERANRTPFPIAAYIDRAIYNPFWNVTPRVRTNEILPEVKQSVELAYERKRLKKIEEEQKYEVLRRALQGGDKSTATPSSDRTFASTNLNAPKVGQPANTPAVVGETPEKPKGLTAASFAAFAANPEEYPYYNAETNEIDVSTTIPGKVPAWYAENNYEVMYPSKSWEYVRMTPGDHNALGRVKVIFPNLHDVYLHDTNAKALFSRDIRAFSHGCMRMSKPLGFAEYLLRRDGQYEALDIPKVLKEGTYLPAFLQRQVPVYVEYHTVRIDDDGRANFLSDIYDIDAQGIVIPKEDAKKKAAAP